MRDPLRHEILLSFRGEYHPLGFPLVVHSNDAAVLEAASASWCGVPPGFSVPPLELRVVVNEGEEMPPSPVFRSQRHLMAIVADARNFAVCDHAGQFAFVNLSAGAMKDPAFVRYHFLEAAAFHLLTQLYVTPVHAACVERDGRGVLLCGPSGAGKSCLAYACARAGFTYVSDNESWLVRGRDEPLVVGDPRRIRFRDTAMELFGELRACASYVSPAGKRSVDLPEAGFAGIRRAFQCPVSALVLLNRCGSGMEPVERGRILEELLAPLPVYDTGVSRAHCDSLERLTRLPAFEMRYRDPADGVAQLGRLLEQL